MIDVSCCPYGSPDPIKVDVNGWLEAFAVHPAIGTTSPSVPKSVHAFPFFCPSCKLFFSFQFPPPVVSARLLLWLCEFCFCLEPKPTHVNSYYLAEMCAAPY
jgi:hypothetical protein